MPVHVGEAALNAVVVEGEAFVVYTEEVEGGGVEIIGVGGVFVGLPAELVGGSVADASLDASAGQPGGKGPCVVVATEGAIALCCRLTTKLGGADDKGLVEQAMGIEVFQ